MVVCSSVCSKKSWNHESIFNSGGCAECFRNNPPLAWFKRLCHHCTQLAPFNQYFLAVCHHSLCTACTSMINSKRPICWARNTLGKMLALAWWGAKDDSGHESRCCKWCFLAAHHCSTLKMGFCVEICNDSFFKPKIISLMATDRVKFLLICYLFHLIRINISGIW